MATSIASGARAALSRGPLRSGRPATPGPEGREIVPSSPRDELTKAKSRLENKRQQRLDQEVSRLTVRYGGDDALARRIAEDRAKRNFAASSPDFAAEIAPLEQKVADLEEQIRKAAQRRGGGATLGAGGGETLGG